MSGLAAQFLGAVAVGVAIAAPVGAMGMLCIRRTLAGGQRAGIATGLGIATGDAMYAALAAFGLTVVTEWLSRHQSWLQLLGGAALVYLGVRAARSCPEACTPAPMDRRSAAGLFSSAVGLTLSNPTTVAAFAIVMAGTGVLRADPTYVGASVTTAGVFTGSLLWWLVLTGVLALLRSHVPERFLLHLNRISGLALAVFGIVLGSTALLP